MEGTEALHNVARELTLSFGEEYNLLGSHSYHSLFQEGDGGREISNIIYGLYKGKSLHCFDYCFYFNTRSGRDYCYYSCVLYDFDGEVQMKRLDIRPENFFDKLVGAGGFGNINFESREFSSKFHVESEDRKFAYDVIHTRMMEFLLQNEGSCSFEIKEHSILLYKKGKLDSQEVEHMLDTMVGFINLIPAYANLLPELKEGNDRYTEDIGRRIGQWLIIASVVPLVALFVLVRFGVKTDNYDLTTKYWLILVVISISLFVTGRILRR